MAQSCCRGQKWRDSRRTVSVGHRLGRYTFHFNGLDYTAGPQGSMIILPFQDGYADNVGKVVRFDPEQAKKDLDAAGWMVGPDGVRVRDGQPLRFTYVNTGDDAVGKAVAGGTAAMLKNIGVQMDIRQVPSGDFSKIVIGKRFDMFYSGVSQSDSFGIAYICQVYCSNSGLIKSGVNDPQNDELVKSVNTLPTPTSSTRGPPWRRRPN